MIVPKVIRRKISQFLDLFPPDQSDRVAKFRQLVEQEDAERSLLSEFHQYLIENWTSDKYYVYRLPYRALPEGWHDEDALDMIRGVFTEEEMAMEFDVIWQADSQGPFRASVLQHATDESLDCELTGDGRSNYYLGCDPGTVNSKFAIAVLKQLGEDVVALVHMHVVDGIQMPDQARTCFEKLNTFWPVPIFSLDKGAGGGGMPLASVMSEDKDVYRAWGKLGPIKQFPAPDEAIDYGSDHLSRTYRVIDLVNMLNPTVTQICDQMLADLQRGRFIIAGTCSGIDEEHEKIYADIRETKRTMTRLVRKVSGSGIKYDLPNPEQHTMHVHDDWSALVLAYGGYLKLKEKPEEDDYSEMFGLGGWAAW